MPGARCARSRVWCVESTRVSHHGHTGNTRHSPRNGFTAYIALSRVTGLSCHPRRRSCLHQLDSSVGASGPHDFPVREIARSSAALLASTASRPAFVTIASRPSVERDGAECVADLGVRSRTPTRGRLARRANHGRITRCLEVPKLEGAPGLPRVSFAVWEQGSNAHRRLRVHLA